MQSAKAEKNSGYVTPSGATCYDQDEMKDLASFKKSCDVCKLDLKDTTNTLGECVNYNPSKWWNDPKLIIGGFVVSLSVGIVAGLLIWQ